MSYNNNYQKKKRPGIIINPPTQSTLDVVDLADEDVSYDEDFDPNKTYMPSPQYWQRQSSNNRSNDNNSVEIPAFPQVRDILPERFLIHSDEGLYNNRNTRRDIFNVLHLSRSASP